MSWPPDPPEYDEIEFVCLSCGAKWSAYGTATPDLDPDGGGWEVEVDDGDDECPARCPEPDVDIEGVSAA